MAHFMFEGQRIAYTEYRPPGSAAVTPIRSVARARAPLARRAHRAQERTLILVHGLLLCPDDARATRARARGDAATA